jgi:type IV secretion system protein TrbL
VEFNTLTTTLTSLISSYTATYDRIQPIANYVLRSLAGIEITLLGLYLAIGGEQLPSLLGKFLKLSVWIYITTNFHQLVTVFSQSLIGAGLMAGGKPGNFQVLLDPSKIASYGLKATDALIAAMSNISALDVSDLLILSIIYLAIMATFLLIAVQIFLAVAEFYLISAISGVLIGFGISPHFRFLSEKAIGAVVACSVKLMVLAYVMSMVEPMLASAKFVGPEIKFNELWALLLNTGTIMLFTWTAPSLAAALLSGSPSLSAGGVAQNMMAGAMMVSGAAGLASTVARAGGSLLGAGARAAGTAVGGATAGFAGSPGGAFASHFGAAAGATRAVASGAKNLATAPFSSLRDQFGQGFESGAKSGAPKASRSSAASSPSGKPAASQPSVANPLQVKPQTSVQSPHLDASAPPAAPDSSSPGAAGSSSASAAKPAAWVAHAQRSLMMGPSSPAMPSASKPATPDDDARL